MYFSIYEYACSTFIVLYSTYRTVSYKGRTGNEAGVYRKKFGKSN